nr:MAG TPA: TFIIB zinc-binding [Bacteriophage sp.]
MTESEAVDKLKNMRLFMQTEDKNSEHKFLEDDYKANEMAINALEKQMPKKVQLRHIHKFDGFDDGECPTCSLNVSRDCDGTDVFCSDCGQKLDWGDSGE